ncbi:hypothetical protein ACTNEO_01965 [Gracilibacillus sp. HCP3S3_G5_1]|uniref:hypothetical protein n=1 Tax=unclassified Gracilibacillus TaxID=2625209 RepID=UPI003F8CAFF5
MFTNIENRASKYFQEILALFNVPANEEIDLSWKQKVSESEYWKFQFLLDKKFLTRIYKLTINYHFQIKANQDNFSSGVLQWNYHKKQWITTKNKPHSYCHILNQNNHLKSMIEQLDLERLEIKQNEDEMIITEVPLPGSFMFTLLPPMQYLIKLKQEEIKALKKIPIAIQQILIKMNKES